MRLALAAVLLAGAALLVRWLYFQYPLDNELLYAAWDNDTAKMADLVRRGARVNTRAYELWTPLTGAAEHGRAEAVAFLLAHGADPNRLEGGGNSALFWAAYQGRLDLAQLLVDHGADVNRRGGSPKNLSPRAIAEQRNHPEMVRWLRAHGAG